MAKAASSRLLAVEARVRSRVSTYEICGGQSGTGTNFSKSTFSPVRVIPPMRHTNLLQHAALSGISKTFGSREKLDINVVLFFYNVQYLTYKTEISILKCSLCVYIFVIVLITFLT